MLFSPGKREEATSLSRHTFEVMKRFTGEDGGGWAELLTTVFSYEVVVFHANHLQVALVSAMV